MVGARHGARAALAAHAAVDVSTLRRLVPAGAHASSAAHTGPDTNASDAKVGTATEAAKAKAMEAAAAKGRAEARAFIAAVSGEVGAVAAAASLGTVPTPCTTSAGEAASSFGSAGWREELRHVQAKLDSFGSTLDAGPWAPASDAELSQLLPVNIAAAPSLAHATLAKYEAEAAQAIATAQEVEALAALAAAAYGGAANRLPTTAPQPQQAPPPPQPQPQPQRTRKSVDQIMEETLMRKAISGNQNSHSGSHGLMSVEQIMEEMMPMPQPQPRPQPQPKAQPQSRQSQSPQQPQQPQQAQQRAPQPQRRQQPPQQPLSRRRRLFSPESSPAAPSPTPPPISPSAAMPALGTAPEAAAVAVSAVAAAIAVLPSGVPSALLQLPAALPYVPAVHSSWVSMIPTEESGSTDAPLSGAARDGATTAMRTGAPVAAPVLSAAPVDLFGRPTWGFSLSRGSSQPGSLRSSQQGSLQGSQQGSLTQSPAMRPATSAALLEASPESLALQQWLQMSSKPSVPKSSGQEDTGMHAGGQRDPTRASALPLPLPPPPPLRAVHSVPLVSPRNGVRIANSPPPGNLVGLGRSINLATSGGGE
jgi:hypothetical protein